MRSSSDIDGAGAPSLADGTPLGGYVIGECIGVGGFGEVYRAKHAVIGREVAIKVLHRRYSHDADAIARFVAEARAVNKVSHPGIVEIHDFGTVDGPQYCVMELVVGETLRDLLRKKPKLTLDEALPILQGVADALDAAHGAGVAHRDIKPDNIFVTKDGVKLIDFGLAKLTHGEDVVPVTQTGAVFGTPLYMSPEQCRGKKIDLRTDQYSFGVVAYQMLVGETPFSGDALELALHHLNDPPKPPGIDERVDRVLLALLAKDPNDRPATVREAVDALVGQAPLPTVRKFRRPMLVPLPVVAFAALAVVGGITWFALRETAPKAAVDDCGNGRARLGGIWDIEMRSLVAGRFAVYDRDDVRAAWHSLSSFVDDYAAQWAVQWDAACHSSDKNNDPLLYVQRRTCLENTLIEIRGATESLLEHDIGAFSEGFTGELALPSLSDCESVPVLRTQTPAPPPEKLEAVAAQMIDADNARVEARDGINVGRPGAKEQGIAHMKRVVAALEALHPPAALAPAYWLARYTKFIPEKPEDDVAMLAHLHELATKVGDERWQAMAYYEDAWRARAASQDQKALELLTLGDQAAARAGKPWLATLLLERLRGWVEIRLGHFDDAVVHLRESSRQFESQVSAVGDDNGHTDLITLLRWLGRNDEAVDESKRLVDMIDKSTGGYAHRFATEVHHNHAETLFRAGKVDDAFAEILRTLDDTAKLKHLPVYEERAYGALFVAYVIANQLGEAQVDQVLARHRQMLHPAWDATTADLFQIALATMQHGDLAASRSAFERALAVNEGNITQKVQVAEFRAYLALMEGDVATAAAMAQASIANDFTGQERKHGHAPWLLVWAEASAGKRDAARARMAKLDANEPNTQLTQVIALAALGDWRAALPRARAVIKNTGPAPSFDRADNLAWGGTVEVEAGELAAAIPHLEKAIGTAPLCCTSDHYFIPMARFALARALVGTNGDRKRAHELAIAARDGFFATRVADKQRVEAWLAANP